MFYRDQQQNTLSTDADSWRSTYTSLHARDFVWSAYDTNPV
jgi:hypothetical protein